MSVWKKLFTAIKGGVNETAESVADSQALRILDQEIREAKQELRRSDEALVGIVAKRKLSQQKVDGFNNGITEYEGHARNAMEKGQQDLALECAQKVANLRNEQQAEQAYLEQFIASEQRMRTNISQAKDKLRQLEQQVDVVKANEAVQKAQTAVSATNVGANAKMHTAVESLDRIKQRQAEKAAQLEAAAEMAEEQSGSALDKKLADAGITSGKSASAEDELKRILGQ
ncbi:PspA/IM30 family protein [Photobacterium aphoticum]|uniref:Phage shock protein A n=1 Tax=Photobacterium aphoticum TaxID=754436 RepID=A0A090QMZ7_9GAMM|nr:PspA/IM30 family protein [Photobacterium aphoticum]KLU99143.1 phage shock protein A (IM30), suppresses sigma54-dependent transcription [Photobacterium aphoticum]PSU59068.1 phage shock protein A [Photobacterium aphoticum]GAL04311.1 phage shock protein A [Photobacterium aphoticum]GHA45260.1 phage shock protein A [Photobacterium aphoticum]